MYKIMLYGDSIAAGLLNGTVSHLIDDFILSELSDKKFDNITIENRGVPGASTTSALESINEINSISLDYMIFIIGVNDAINNKENITEYKDNLRKMILKTQAKNIILLGPSYVDKKLKPQVDYPILEKYILVAKEVAESENICFLDTFQCMTDYPEMNDLLQDDGLHPSRFGYHYIAKKIVDIISKG